MAKPEIVSRAWRTDTPRLPWMEINPLGNLFRCLLLSVCFVFDGGDKVRGEKVYECS